MKETYCCGENRSHMTFFYCLCLICRKWHLCLRRFWIWPTRSPPCSPALRSTPASATSSKANRLRWVRYRRGHRDNNELLSADLRWCRRRKCIMWSYYVHLCGRNILCMQDLRIPYFNITTDITASAMRVHTDGTYSVLFFNLFL